MDNKVLSDERGVIEEIHSAGQVTGPKQGALSATGIIRVILTRNIGRRAFLKSENVNRLLKELPTNASEEEFSNAFAKGRKLDEEAAIVPYMEFQRLRGTPVFANAIRDLEAKIAHSNHFELDKEVVATKRIGNEMDILSQYLLEYELMPVYRFKENEQETGISFRPQVQIPEEARWRLQNFGLTDADVSNILNTSNDALATEWAKWPTKKIMLSKYGLYQIVLERKLEEPTLIANILDHVVGLEQKLDITPIILGELEKAASKTKIDLQGNIPEEVLETEVERMEQAGKNVRQKLNTKKVVETSLDHSVQWELVGELIRRFLETFGGGDSSASQNPVEGTKDAIGSLTIEEENQDPTILQFKERSQKAITKGNSYNLRTRYVVFELHELFRDSEEPIDREDLIEPEICDLNCLLEGVLLSNIQGNSKILAPIKTPPHIDRPKDVSTWKGELCWFSSDNAVIRLRHKADEIYLRFSNSGSVAYKKYWEATILGIAYITELRAVSKLLESDTSDDLEELARHMKDLRLGPRKSTETFMRQIAAKISNSSRLVARVRNAAMPTTIGAPDYAVVKYRELISVFDLGRILQHTDRNIGLIHGFQEHYDEIQLQLDSVTLQQEERTTGIAGALLNTVLAALTVVLAILAVPVFIGELEEGHGAARWIESFHWQGFTPYGVRDYGIGSITLLLIMLVVLLIVSLLIAIRTWRKHSNAKEDMEARIRTPKIN